MKRIGHVLHVSPSKNLVLKAEAIPKIGDKVVDEELRTVGSVLDVFGPIGSPYVAIKPAIPEPKQLVKTTLYAISSSVRRKGKRKRER